MSYLNLTKNGAIPVIGLVAGITTTVVIASTSTLKAKLINACDGTIESAILPAGTYELTGGSKSFPYEIALDCGKLSGTITLTAQNGSLKCAVIEDSTLKRSFMSAVVEGVLNFSSITQPAIYNLTLSPGTYSSITVMRNGSNIPTNTPLGNGDVLTISATETNSDYGVRDLIVNGLKRTNPYTMTVTSSVAISTFVVEKVWTIMHTGGEVLHGTPLSAPNVKSGLPTKFTTGVGFIYYDKYDGCDNIGDSYLIQAKADELAPTGSISEAGSTSTLAYNYTLSALDGELSLNAYLAGGEHINWIDYTYEFAGAKIPIQTVKQFVLPATTTYSLSKTQGETTEITVKVNGSTYLGNEICNGDTLEISASAASGYELSTFTVNGTTRTSPYSMTVTGNVSIITAASVPSWTTIYNGAAANLMLDTNYEGVSSNISYGNSFEIPLGKTQARITFSNNVIAYRQVFDGCGDRVLGYISYNIANGTVTVTDNQSIASNNGITDPCTLRSNLVAIFTNSYFCISENGEIDGDCWEDLSENYVSDYNRGFLQGNILIEVK